MKNTQKTGRDLTSNLGNALPVKVHPRIRSLTRKEVGIGIALLSTVEKEFPNDPLRQVAEFFRRFSIPAGTGRERAVSFGTRAAYKYRMNTLIKKLSKMNMPVKKISSITAHQVKLVFLQLESEGRSASWLANLNSVVRRFGIWMGKRDLCPPISFLVSDPESAKRHYSAIVPKTWQANGVSPAKIFAQISSICPVTSLQLRLMALFGLRVLEAIRLKVFESRILDTQLLLTDGTKGGRPRTVDIETLEQRNLLDEVEARSMLHPLGLMMYDHSKSLQQSRRHFYHVIEMAGITKSDLGVTAHGLRHGDLCDVYLRITGTNAPVLGGGKVSVELNKQAVDVIKKRAGHGRDSVTSAYTGNFRTISRQAASNLCKLLRVVKGNSTITVLASKVGIDSLCVIGFAAQGKAILAGDLLCFAYAAIRQGDETQEMADDRAMAGAHKIAARVGQMFGSLASVVPRRSVEVETAVFELLPFGTSST